MIASAIPTIGYVSQLTSRNSGSCAMKIRIASAFTKPVMTDFDTKRIARPSLSTPAST